MNKKNFLTLSELITAGYTLVSSACCASSCNNRVGLYIYIYIYIYMCTILYKSTIFIQLSYQDMHSIGNFLTHGTVIFVFHRNEVDFWVLTGGTLIGLTKKSKILKKFFFLKNSFSMVCIVYKVVYWKKNFWLGNCSIEKSIYIYVFF